MYFPHPEWGRVARRFTSDVRSALTEWQSWTLAIESPTPRIVDLWFQPEGIPPAVWLFDEATGIRQDLRTNPRYQLTSGTPSSRRTVQLVVGSAAQEEIPLAADLRLDVFPNPVETAATLVVNLPREAETSVRIYDALGREVAALVEAQWQSAGRSVFLWDATNSDGVTVASGLYLIQLESGGAVVSRGITLSN